MGPKTALKLIKPLSLVLVKSCECTIKCKCAPRKMLVIEVDKQFINNPHLCRYRCLELGMLTWDTNCPWDWYSAESIVKRVVPPKL